MQLNRLVADLFAALNLVVFLLSVLGSVIMIVAAFGSQRSGGNVLM